jgi:hypothetical protein
MKVSGPKRLDLYVFIYLFEGVRFFPGSLVWNWNGHRGWGTMVYVGEQERELSMCFGAYEIADGHV